jgi:uncharacterized membrane protein
MRLAKPLIGSAILIGLMLTASAYAWGHLGDGPIATHFGVDGRPNGFTPKLPGLVLLPFMGVLLTGLLSVLPTIMPRNARLERSWGPYKVVWLAVLSLFLAIHVAMLAYALGIQVDMPRAVVVGVGALIAVIGNLSGKIRYNYVFGIRTPWTLSDERVWDHTHRFAGRALVLGGLMMLIVGLVTAPGFESLLEWAVVVGVATPVLASVIYSFVESRRIERTSAI